jgi:thioredoxin 1
MLNKGGNNMAVEEISQDSFKADVEDSDIPVILDFNAEWCMPCQMMKPEFEALSDEYKGKLKFASINSDNNPAISQKFNVSAIPCLVVINKGKEVDRIVGFMPKEALKEKVDEVLSKI